MPIRIPSTNRAWPKTGANKAARAENLITQIRPRHPKAPVDGRVVKVKNGKVEPAYTETQGQYLAFIYYYSKIHSVPPAEADMQRYFNPNSEV